MQQSDHPRHRLCSPLDLEHTIPGRHGDFTVDETDRARFALLRYVQHYAFKQELDALRAGRPLPKDSPLCKLRPFINELDLLCVGGRLEHADAPPDVRHPILLLKNH